MFRRKETSQPRKCILLPFFFFHQSRRVRREGGAKPSLLFFLCVRAGFREIDQQTQASASTSSRTRLCLRSAFSEEEGARSDILTQSRLQGETVLSFADRRAADPFSQALEHTHKYRGKTRLVRLHSLRHPFFQEGTSQIVHYCIHPL